MNKNPQRKVMINNQRRGTILLKNTHSESVERINISNYDLYQILSKTNYGILKLSKHKFSDQYFCMKILKKIDLLEQKTVEHLSNEYRILRKVYHPFIIQLKGINTMDDKYLYFLFEFVQGGEFSLFLTNGHISEESAKFYSAIIITVMDYLHRQNIIMRNICPENIFFTSNGYIKISNFFDSKLLRNEYTNTLCGTPEYYSPEMILRKGHTKYHDMWTLGIFLYHILVGHTPFVDIDPTKIQQNILNGKITFPKFVSYEAKCLIKHLSKLDPKKRLGCGKNGICDIINDPFFKGFDWTNLLLQNLKAPYIPVIENENDFSHFKKYQDDFFDEPEDITVEKNKDPFSRWD